MEKFDLDADLVILSACDSGLTGNQTGLNDLVPAFFAAGARQVIATSWPLEGTAAKTITTGLVADYFAKTPRDFPRSLQAVLLQMVNSPAGTPSRHPYFWAGIILLGSQYTTPRTCEKRPSCDGLHLSRVSYRIRRG